jgi:hypothetical protein
MMCVNMVFSHLCEAPTVTHFVTGVEGHERTSQVAVRDIFDEPKARDRGRIWCK